MRHWRGMRHGRSKCGILCLRWVRFDQHSKVWRLGVALWGWKAESGLAAGVWWEVGVWWLVGVRQEMGCGLVGVEVSSGMLLGGAGRGMESGMWLGRGGVGSGSTSFLTVCVSVTGIIARRRCFSAFEQLLL